MDTKDTKDTKEIKTSREWYVRLENLHLNHSFIGYKRMITQHDHELIDTILNYYGIPSTFRDHIQLWDSPFRNRRLDPLQPIPYDIDFISVYFY